MLRVAIPPPRSGVTPLPGAIHELTGRTMGTTWAVKLAGAALPARLREEIEARLDTLVAQMSHWEPDSELSRFNRSPAGERTPISADFAEVVACALEIARATEGAFDPALFGAASRWGFGPPGATTGFSPGSWRGLQLEDGRLLQPGGVRLDLSGIAKGYAVDAVAALLERRGCGAFLVEIGGELYGRGVKPDGSPWFAAVDAPRGEPHDAIHIALPGWAVATSGDYRRLVNVDGVRRAHTLDPRTGDPLTSPPASVSVLAAHCMHADAWATALTVLGEVDGLGMADRLGLPALFLLAKDDRVRAAASSAWAALWA